MATIIKIIVYYILLYRTTYRYTYRLYHGVPVSKVQLRLATLLNIDSSCINYPIGPYYVDIVYVEDRIVLEYDGYYWHKGRNDRRRTNYILKHGWKMIRIKSNSKLPARSVLKQKLERARKGTIYQEIILDDWGEKKCTRG